MRLAGAQVVVVVADGYEELEFWYAVLRLREANVEVTVLGVDGTDVVSGRCAYPVVPEVALDDYAAEPALVVVPGLSAGAVAKAAPFVGKWRDAGALVVATSSGVGALAATGIDAGSDGVFTAESAADIASLYEEVLGDDAGPKLPDVTVAVLCENVYQELELWYPLLRLRGAGARVYTVGPKKGAMYTSKLGYPVVADLDPSEVDASDFDAIVIPGGHSPEGMRRSADLIDLVRKADERGAIVAAICHAGWVLASAGIARGRRLTCVPIIRDDVINAGGNYVTEQLVRDGNLITSRLPSDLPVFLAAIVGALAEAPRESGTQRRDFGAPASSPVYDRTARLVPKAIGVASPDYTQVSSFVGA